MTDAVTLLNSLVTEDFMDQIMYSIYWYIGNAPLSKLRLIIFINSREQENIQNMKEYTGFWSVPTNDKIGHLSHKIAQKISTHLTCSFHISELN